MPETERCCGSCSWWTRAYTSIQTGDEHGDCRWCLHNPTPSPVNIRHKIETCEIEGTDCPCWQAKESEAKRDG